MKHTAGELRALEMEKDRKTGHPLISGLDERWAKGKGQGEQADRLKLQIGVCVYQCVDRSVCE